MLSIIAPFIFYLELRITSINALIINILYFYYISKNLKLMNILKKYITITMMLLLFFTLNIKGQDNKEGIKISILVKDSKNKPISGAVILFDDVKLKRWTNSKGVLKTKVAKAPKEISAFYPTIGIKKITYDGSENVVIVIKKKNDPLLIGDSNNKVASTTQYWNIYDYLRGRVPGVNITSDNVINIRGYNSVNANTTPLFVLNGTAVSQTIFSRIIPNTIKSVKILKGPDTAFYGARGANGVIIVETN